MRKRYLSVIFIFLVTAYLFPAQAQQPKTYTNPILFADFSDPDVIRHGDDYYMVASSFTCQPGIPVLHSRDLVTWRIVNYVYDSLPLERYRRPQHGQGSWAPSIRFHRGLFYVYFCTPDDGLFVATAKDPAGKWTLDLVQEVAGWEDPCPFWDEDGQAYLLRGRVGAGPAILHKMSADGKRLLDDGVLIHQDLTRQPVLEGFKFMDKRDGYYYFSAPAGGVATGWQSVFRSKNIYGPYEDKIVLNQGKTNVNGPHQGGLVETQTGEWWFIHFQDRGPYGRIVHLQPVEWKNGWPVMGADPDGDGIGEPVQTYRYPNVGKTFPEFVLQTSDEFGGQQLGLQWQWQAAPDKKWYSLTANPGSIRLFAAASSSFNGSVAYAGNLLLQKITAPSFTATTRLEFNARDNGERAGLVVAGNSSTFICLEKRPDGNSVALYESKRGTWQSIPKELASEKAAGNLVWLKVTVFNDATCSYAYSFDGKEYQKIGERYKFEAGGWIGAKIGLFCLTPSLVASNGYGDFDFFKVEKQ